MGGVQAVQERRGANRIRWFGYLSLSMNAFDSFPSAAVATPFWLKRALVSERKCRSRLFIKGLA